MVDSLNGGPIMQRIFTIYTDPSHGWLKVPMALLAQLGIADKISHYSYMRKAHAFLEEDLDLAVFMNAYRAAAGCDPVIRESNRAHGYSRIRGYPYYRFVL